MILFQERHQERVLGQSAPLSHSLAIRSWQVQKKQNAKSFATDSIEAMKSWKFTVKANSEMVRNTEKLPSGPVVYKRGIWFATEQIQNTSAMRANAWKFKEAVSQTLLGVVENFMCMP